MDNMDDLLKEAELLARHMSSYQHDLPPDLQSESQVGEDAKSELMKQCEELWAEVGQCQNKTMVLDDEKLPESDVQLYLLMLKVKALTAEYEQWEKREPDIISPNQDILLAAGKEELKNVDQGLEMMISQVRSKNKKLKADLETEQRWLNEQQEAMDAICAKLEELKTQSAHSTENGVRQELKTKLKRVKSYRDELLTALRDFLSEHFPLPESQASQAKKRKAVTGEPPVNWIPLEDIIETLVTRLIDFPHDPYASLEKEFWPPYIEMLLRYGVVLRHPQDSNKIRLEGFHQ